MSRYAGPLSEHHDESHLTKFELLLEASLDLEAVPHEYLISAAYDTRLQVGCCVVLRRVLEAWEGGGGEHSTWLQVLRLDVYQCNMGFCLCLGSNINLKLVSTHVLELVSAHWVVATTQQHHTTSEGFRPTKQSVGCMKYVGADVGANVVHTRCVRQCGRRNPTHPPHVCICCRLATPRRCVMRRMLLSQRLRSLPVLLPRTWAWCLTRQSSWSGTRQQTAAHAACASHRKRRRWSGQSCTHGEQGAVKHQGSPWGRGRGGVLNLLVGCGCSICKDGPLGGGHCSSFGAGNDRGWLGVIVCVFEASQGAT